MELLSNIPTCQAGMFTEKGKHFIEHLRITLIKLIVDRRGGGIHGTICAWIKTQNQFHAVTFGSLEHLVQYVDMPHGPRKGRRLVECPQFISIGTHPHRVDYPRVDAHFLAVLELLVPVGLVVRPLEQLDEDAGKRGLPYDGS